MSTTTRSVYTLQLDDDQLRVIGAGLGEVPFRLAKPVIDVIQAQVDAQEASWRKAAEAAKAEVPPQGP